MAWHNINCYACKKVIPGVFSESEHTDSICEQCYTFRSLSDSFFVILSFIPESILFQMREINLTFKFAIEKIQEEKLREELSFEECCYHNYLLRVEKMKEKSNLNEGFRGACRGSRAKLIRWLYFQGADEEIGFLGACEGGQFKLVKQFVQQGKGKLEDGLKIVCYKGYFDIAKWLFKRIDKMYSGDYVNMTPKRMALERAFNAACEAGQLEIAKWLFGKEEIEVLSKSLALASSKNRFEVVKWLVTELKLAPDSGIKAASQAGHFELVKWLLEQVHEPKSEFDLALFGACSGGHLPIVQWLSDRQVDFKSGYILACEADQLEVVKWLTENYENLPILGLYGACRENQIKTVEWLLKYSKGISDLNLYIACSENNHEIMKLLIQNGAVRCSYCEKSIEEHLE